MDYKMKYHKYKSKYLSQKGGNNYLSYIPDDSEVINIEEETLQNTNYRKVIHTTDYSQIVLMRLTPGTEIGMELHSDTDQFIRVEKGNAKFSKGGNKIDSFENSNDHMTIYDKNMEPISKIINSDLGDLPKDHVLLVPRNTWHNVWNPKDSLEDVFIYTIYSFGKQNPPHKNNMRPQVTKDDEKYEEH